MEVGIGGGVAVIKCTVGAIGAITITVGCAVVAIRAWVAIGIAVAGGRSVGIVLDSIDDTLLLVLSKVIFLTIARAVGCSLAFGAVLEAHAGLVAIRAAGHVDDVCERVFLFDDA